MKAPKKKLSPRRKKVLIFSLVLLVLAGLVAGFFYWKTHQPADLTTQKKPQTTQEKVDILTASDEAGDLAKAQTELQKLADNESDPAKKTVYLASLSDVYARTDNYDKAAEVAKEAETQVQTVETAARLGAYLQESGQYKEAAKYFGIAAERAPGKPDSSPYTDYKLMQKEALEVAK